MDKKKEEGEGRLSMKLEEEDEEEERAKKGEKDCLLITGWFLVPFSN